VDLSAECRFCNESYCSSFRNFFSYQTSSNVVFLVSCVSACAACCYVVQYLMNSVIPSIQCGTHGFLFIVVTLANDLSCYLCILFYYLNFDFRFGICVVEIFGLYQNPFFERHKYGGSPVPVRITNIHL